MTWQGPEFVLAIIAMSFVGWIATSWIRAKHGYPVENEWGGMTQPGSPDAERKIALLSTENDDLKGKMLRLEERISVLERIATDPPNRLSAEIENLR